MPEPGGGNWTLSHPRTRENKGDRDRHEKKRMPWIYKGATSGRLNSWRKLEEGKMSWIRDPIYLNESLCGLAFPAGQYNAALGPDQGVEIQTGLAVSSPLSA